jgi:hypothetical protein
MVIQSIFSAEVDEQGTDGEESAGIIRANGISSLSRLPGALAHGANGLMLRKHADISKKDSDQLRQKYFNAKSNFSAVVVRETLVVSTELRLSSVVLAWYQTEAKKDKEESRKTINELRRRITQLEDSLTQKSREFDHALLAEKARSSIEIQQLLVNNGKRQEQQHPTMVTAAGLNTKPPRPSSASSYEAFSDNEQAEQRLRQRMNAVEQSKNTEIALIRQQYDQILKQRNGEAREMREQLDLLQLSTTQTVEVLAD